MSTTVLPGAGGPPELAVPVDVRRVQPSAYRISRRSEDRLEETVRTLDAISRALVGGVDRPRTLVEEVVRAAATHLEADWMVLALADGALSDARPR